MTASTRLTATFVKSAPVGLHADGQGLYLRVDSAGKRWTYIFTWEGRRREMGLGRYDPDTMTLAMAREKVVDVRKLIQSGVDPIDERRKARLKGKTMT